MPQSKAIIIPAWVNMEKKKQQPGADSLYHQLPNLMHWRCASWMERTLMFYTANQAARNQLQFIIEQVKKHLTDQDTNPVVARVSLSKYIPKELIIGFAVDIQHPSTIANIVVRLTDDGCIKDVAREYSMSYPADKDQPKTSYERQRANH